VDDGKDAKEKEGTPTGDREEEGGKGEVGYDLENMSRVLPAQVKYISFPGERYVRSRR